MAIIGNAYVVVHAITSNFQNQVGDALNGINKNFSQSGQQAGRSFSNGLNRGTKNLSQFKREALQANDAFFKMVTTGYALGPAISVAVGALSSLVSGLVALTAQVSLAVPALIVIPSLLSAMAQAALVAKAAFGGIGAALKQLTGKKGGGGGDSQKRIQDAEKRLAQVLEQNRESLARANDRLADAEERLTEARKEASESLQQLNFDAEDAAIAEKRAAIELERARETLARVQDLPPNSRARREAQLAYQEADLNLRRAKDRNSDLTKETEEQNKKGVEGSKSVVDATKAVQEATDARAQAELDAIRAQIDALEALEAARKGGGGGGGEDAMKKLSAAAQEFVRYLTSVKPRLTELRDAAATSLLPPLQTAISTLVDKLFPRLFPIIEKTGKALGQTAIDFANIVTEGQNLEKLDAVAETNSDTLGKLGTVVGNLYDGFLSLLAAADPLVRKFTDWLVKVTETWKNTRQLNLDTGKTAKTFERAGEIAAQLGTIFGNIGEALMNIGRAAAGPGSGGEMLLDMFEDSTARFAEFTKELLDSGELKQFFIDVAENAGKVSRLVVKIVKEFLKLGDNKAIGATADTLGDKFVPVLGTIFDTLQSAGPYVGEFLGKLASLVMKFTETKSMEMFFGVLGKGLDILNAIFGNETVQKILLVVAPIMGAVKALTLMGKVGGFVVKVIAGYGVKLGAIFTGLKSALVAIGAVFGGGAGMGALVVGAVVAIGAALYMCWQNSEIFREAVKDLVEAVWGTLVDAFNGIKGAIDDVLSRFGGAKGAADGLSNAFKAIGDFLGKYFIPALKSFLIPTLKAIQAAIEAVIYVIGGIIKAFQAVWEFVSGIFSLLRGDIDGFKEHMGKAWEAIKDAVILILNGIWNAVKAVFYKIMSFLGPLKVAFKLAWDIIKKIVMFVFDVIKTAFKVVVGIIKFQLNIIKTAFEFVWKAIKAYFTFVWNVIKTAIKIGVEVIKTYFNVIKTAFEFVWNGIKAFFTTIWDGIKLAIDTGVAAITLIFNGLQAAGEAVWNGIKSVFEAVWNPIETTISIGVGVIKSVIEGIKTTFETVFNALADIARGAFEGVVGVISGLINAVLGVLEVAVNAAIKVTNGVIRGINWINPFEDIPYINEVDFGIGEDAPGAESAGIWGRIVGAAIAQAGGPRRSGGKTATPMAEGGVISPSPGGTLAVIGEAGRSERVEPLDPDGLSRRDKAMISHLTGGTRGGIQVHVYPSAGMDERELAALVSRQLAVQLRRGEA